MWDVKIILAQHARADHSLEELCLLCTNADNKIYKARAALSQHIRSSHSDEKICKDCGFEAASVQKLLTHLKAAKHTRKVMCEDCSQGFLSQGRLRQHREEKHGFNKWCIVFEQK